jgi:hypothetical protein
VRGRGRGEGRGYAVAAGFLQGRQLGPLCCGGWFHKADVIQATWGLCCLPRVLPHDGGKNELQWMLPTLIGSFIPDNVA